MSAHQEFTSQNIKKFWTLDTIHVTPVCCVLLKIGNAPHGTDLQRKNALYDVKKIEEKQHGICQISYIVNKQRIKMTFQNVKPNIKY